MVNLRKRKLVEIANSCADENAESALEFSDDQSYYSEEGESDEELKQSKAQPNLKKISRFVDACSEYKLHTYETNGKKRKVLIIFTDAVKNFCYEYSMDKKYSFYCRGCFEKQKYHRTKIHINKDGIESVKMNAKPHVCEPREYIPEKFKSPIILKKPDYVFKESLVVDKTTVKLIVFHREDKELCYEFHWSSSYNSYCCCGCNLLSKTIKAKVYNLKTNEEFIEIDDRKHVCELRIYNPNKYFNENQIINLPNFELREKNDEDGYKYLILFDIANKNLCYKYSFQKQEFRCQKCVSKYVYAKLYYNEKNEPYIVLGQQKHVCEPQPYKPEIKEIVIESTHFKFIPMAKGKPKLIIYATEKKDIGYEMTLKENNSYICMGCVRRQKNQIIVPFYAKLSEKENGEKYLILKKALKHECNFKKFQPDKEIQYEEKFLFAPNFIFYFNKNVSKKPSLVIYDLNDKTLGYDYSYKPSQGIFLCKKCIFEYKISVSAKVMEDKNGKEYLCLGMNKHRCTPENISNLLTPEKVIMESSEVAIKDKENIDEKQIINFDSFELRSNKSGVVDAELIIFKSDDRSLCYRYCYFKCRKKYYCSNCLNQKKKNVTAELNLNDNGEKYLILGKNQEHLCEPIKYDDIKETKYYNFQIFNLEDKNKATTLFVFISNNQKQCYKYWFCNRNKLFYCCSCVRKQERKYINAKIDKDEDGKEYIKFGPNKHVCAPQEYDPEKFESKQALQASEFELFPNLSGIPDSRILIFDKNNQNLIYEYHINKKQFCCYDCNRKDVYVSLKLFTNESEEKYIELDNTKHICTQRNLVERKRMFMDFKIKNSLNGNQDVVVTDTSNKSLTFNFALDNELNLYYCIKCKEKNKFITYKLRKTEDEKEILIFNESHHCCSRK